MKRFITAVVSILFVGFLLLVSYSGPVEDGPVYAPFHGAYRITFSGGTFSADEEELKFPIKSEDFELLSYFENLRSADFSGSSCYDEMLEWSAQHPDVKLTYTVSFPTGLTVDNHAESLDLSGTSSEQVEETAELLKLIPGVTAINLGSSTAEASLKGEELALIQSAAPNAELSYCIELLGEPVSLDVESLDLSTLAHEDVESVFATISCMPHLKSIDLGSEDTNDLSFADIARLQEGAPSAEFNYSFTLWEQKINISDESMNFSHIPMDDNGDAVYEALSVMKNCKYVDMDTCEISNERMAEIRDAYPDTKVVWRIWFGTGYYSVRTDVEKILASKPSKAGPLNNENIQNLQYCQDLKYLDIGHSECITDLSFAYGTPNLEVLILLSDLDQAELKNAPHVDLTPLASCPELEYMELASTSISDLTPLSGLTNLRHLNMGCCPNVSDISPLYGLTKLERLWIGRFDPVPAEQIAEMQKAAPDCVIDTESGDLPTEGAWRYADLNDEGWATWEKYGYFEYENHPRYDLLREQFGYADGLAAYAFASNDPLY